MTDPDTIIRTVAEQHGVEPADVVGPTHRRQPTRARQQAITQIRTTHPHLTLAQIGELFGGRHHTTVLYSLRQTRRTRQYGEACQAALNEIIHPAMFPQGTPTKNGAQTR